MGTPSPRCTVELKQKAVELYGKSGTTCAEVARGLGCDAGSLSDWAMNADAARPALDKPFSLMIRQILRLLTVLPDLASAAFVLREP